MDEKERRIRELLRPMIHTEELRSHSFLEEDINAFLDFVVGFHIEDTTILYLQRRADATAQDLWHFISDNAPEMLDDEEEDEG